MLRNESNLDIPLTDGERIDDAYQRSLNEAGILAAGSESGLRELMEFVDKLPPKERESYAQRLNRIDQIGDAMGELQVRYADRGLPPAKPFASLAELSQAKYASDRDGALARDFQRRLAVTDQRQIDAWGSL